MQLTSACQATRKDGSPCQAQVLPSDSYCWFHSPEKAEERRQVRRKGGANSATNRRLAKLMPPRLVAVYDTLEKALEEVHAGELEPRNAQAMAALAGAMVKVLQSGELEQRVRDLESRRNGDGA